MERLAELIGKLKEQFEQKADHSQLLVTTQMIEQELTRSISASEPPVRSSKVSVLMPGRKPLVAVEQPAIAEEKAIVETPEINKLHHTEPIPSKEEEIHHPHLDERVDAIKPHVPRPASKGWTYDPVREIPTLAHQETFRELNEVIGHHNSSLNDKLKEEVVEVGHRLTDSPIRDLKRAIGVNDRFLFISELFRGDEVMYERSLKTINNFRIYAEAEYWIERELKVKLGWEESKPATRHFYQLVRRRFA